VLQVHDVMAQEVYSDKAASLCC